MRRNMAKVQVRTQLARGFDAPDHFVPRRKWIRALSVLKNLQLIYFNRASYSNSPPHSAEPPGMSLTSCPKIPQIGTPTDRQKKPNEPGSKDQSNGYTEMPLRDMGLRSKKKWKAEA